MSTALHPAIAERYPFTNEAQRDAISNTEGPLLVIAGPGSGKTFVLVLRTLNILLHGLAPPKQIVLCTFTEKAAFELRDRITQAARTLGYNGDLSQLQVSTIHGLCNKFLMRFRHHTSLQNGFEVLDELTQSLFLFENFEAIVGEPTSNGLFLGHWKTWWTVIEGVRGYFDKITEELVDPTLLHTAPDPHVREVGLAYQRYETALRNRNRLDFAHQQKLFLDLLHDSTIAQQILGDVRYVMVDEYQDTNYIQEQIVLALAGKSGNLCVVGDDDQSLYRFRGATVRNILEFSQHFTDCAQVWLTLNYRSHKQIIAAYNRYMGGCNWSNPGSLTAFRYAKTIQENPDGDHPDYPAVIQVWGADELDEARRIADLVDYLKRQSVIEDYNQVALLLHSVRGEHSEPYIEALRGRSIRVFAPRARAYFDKGAVKLLVGCFAVLLGWYGNNRGELKGHGLQELAQYVDGCLAAVARAGVVSSHPLAGVLQQRVAEIDRLRPGETLNRHLADYLYEFLAHQPFAAMLADENEARNLAIFSQLIAVFQHYYHYSVITHANHAYLRLHFFNSFLRFLFLGGINEYEDPDQPFPPGHVQIMTIHQSKGLEFPVVIVGSLAANISSAKQIDKALGQYYRRKALEPESRITEFDRMRLHYVAFSRAEKLLVLTSVETPKDHFNPIWQGLPQWPYVQKQLLVAQHFALKQRVPLKKTFSFTNHVKVYETCPRQYQYFREYEFTPARSAEIFFGSLMHGTIEDIHRWILEGQRADEIRPRIATMFEANFSGLVNAGYRPLNDAQRDLALREVKNYFEQNLDRMGRVIATEVDVSFEKDDYILTGRVDLLLGEDDRLELLDFKSQPRLEHDDRRLKKYYEQLLIYAHVLEQRYGKHPERLALYWTGEQTRERALMIFPYQPDKVDSASEYFEGVVAKILARDFSVRERPAERVCAECDFKVYCGRQGTINITAG